MVFLINSCHRMNGATEVFSELWKGSAAKTARNAFFDVVKGVEDFTDALATDLVSWLPRKLVERVNGKAWGGPLIAQFSPSSSQCLVICDIQEVL